MGESLLVPGAIVGDLNVVACYQYEWFLCGGFTSLLVFISWFTFDVNDGSMGSKSRFRIQHVITRVLPCAVRGSFMRTRFLFGRRFEGQTLEVRLLKGDRVELRGRTFCVRRFEQLIRHAPEGFADVLFI